MNRKTAISEELKNLSDRVINIRRHLHQFPELSQQENRTSSYIAEILEKEGVAVTKGIAGTGLVAALGQSGKTIAFRCDLDALPITEETGAAYASQCPGIMHACGHDVHTAIVAGTVLLLNKLKGELKGRIKFIFQPAEEALSGGAELVVREGVLDDVESIFGIHVDPGIPYGKFGLKDEAMMASVDFFDIVVKGQGGHGARPHETVDTVFVSSQVVQAVYRIQNLYFSSLENPTVLSVGRIQGGTAHNIIPPECAISGTFRTFDDSDRIKMRSLITKAAEQTCGLFGAECEIKITPNAPPVINDASLGRLIESVVEDVFGKAAIDHLKFPMTASEDFAYYREKCPIYFLRIGASSGPKTSYPLHHSKFDVDESIIANTVELMSHVLLRYFEK